jgi:putative transposase
LSILHHESEPFVPTSMPPGHVRPTTLDIQVGEKYILRLSDSDTPVLTEFKKEMSDGALKFERVQTGYDKIIALDEFEIMRSDGRAVRVLEGKRGRSAEEIEDLDPLALLDPDEPSIKVKERNKRLKAAQRLKEARTLRFYVLRYDEEFPGTGGIGVTAWIHSHFEAAKAAGFDWKPSYGALLRAVNKYGAPGERPLSVFFNKRGCHQRENRWPKATTDLALAMTNAYWTNRTNRICDVIATFYTDFKKLYGDAEMRGEVVRPTKETLRLWIKSYESYWTWSSRYGEKAARRRFKGHGRSISATRPLEFVMFDHTQIDAWVVIFDENGAKKLVERPWLTLAVDVYSQAILGAVLTYEHPSVYSALLCLKQVVRRKTWLIEKYGYGKGATDCWGKPHNIIVDNGWEWCGQSFQVCCEAAGIDVLWAPVKTPQFKAFVERAFHMLNQNVWHRLEAGIPLKPHQMTALGLDPSTKAIHDIHWHYDRMWAAIVTIYHVESPDGVDLAPAVKFHKGIVRTGRPTIDDVAELDKVLGRSKVCLLTTSGITIDNHRFHDQEITGELLDRLLRLESKGSQRKGLLSSGTVSVQVTEDPLDCSYIHVWDRKLKKQIRLLNWDRKYTVGMSWKAAADIREFARKENLRYHSEDEKYAARDAFNKSLTDEFPDLDYRDARKHASRLQDPQLVAGNNVEFAKIDPVADPLSHLNIPHGMPARERDDARLQDKGPKRGGKAATRKAQATRQRRERQNSAVATAASSLSATKPDQPESTAIDKTEAEKRLADLEAKLSWNASTKEGS